MSVEYLPSGEPRLGKRPVEDVKGDGEKILVRAYQLISDKTTANAVAKQKLPSLEVLMVNRFVEACIEQDAATDINSALLDIYKKIRPGDPATPAQPFQ